MKQVKSKKRVLDHGEVFTSDKEVKEMLDLIKQETERIESRFFEPACGNGNFLFEILKRKFEVVERRYSKNNEDYNKYMVLSVTSIYGVELLEDNTIECRKRLLNFFVETYKLSRKIMPNEEIYNSIFFILQRNIQHGDALTLLTDEGTPIIFSEWSLVNSDYIKRRDFKLSEMLMFPPISTEERNVSKDYYVDDLFSDVAIDNLTIRVFAEFPLTKYWRLYESAE